MEHLTIDGQQFYKMVANGSKRLEEQKEFVNSLNVFPVPDGDTGTNMSMTFKAAVEEIKLLANNNIGQMSKKLAKGALMGARGNSGVILSQIFRGIAKGFEEKDVATVEDFANCFIEGAASAYKAVMRPTEGTILTIIRTASETAKNTNADNINDLMNSVCRECEIMLNKTPEMLPVLKKAKVVDAGGMGLLIIIKGMFEALENDFNVVLSEVSPKETVKGVKKNLEQDIKFGYCTEFIIISENVDVEKFKNEISKYGDSMIVVGVEDIVKVHIHTNDPGYILTQAVKYGELSKIKIDNMREEHRTLLLEESALTSKDTQDSDQNEFKKNAFISVAMGEGIKNIFEDLGVDFVIEGGQTMNPSTQDIIECINKLNAENIFILPNNKNIIMAATQAAEISDKNVIVIPTKTIPQGITAITMYNPEAELADNINEMNETLSLVKTGSITYAVRDTEMDGIDIKEGNILGLVDGKISKVGEDVYEVCENMLENMVDEDSELITIFYGKDCDSEITESFINKIKEKYSDIDIHYYNGKQPLYYFILSVE